LVKIIKIFN